MGQMTSVRFFELVDAYGANLESWPEAERAAAGLIAESGGAAKAYLAQARELDVMLDGSLAATPSHELEAAIIANARATLAPHKPTPIRPSLAVWLTDFWQSLLSPIGIPASAVWMLALAVGAVGLVTGVAVSVPEVSDEDVIAFYGEESDFWVSEFDPETIELNGDGT